MPSPLQPLEPLYTAHLFEPLHQELLRLLRGLGDDDWERPTVAGRWRVCDVVAHLLDGDLRALSVLRDGHSVAPPEPIAGYRELVGFLDRLNAEWVTAARRLSPRVLLELLAHTGPAVVATFATLPPHGPARFAVAWAGEERSENWMHVGRDYTERWHHQMQVRDAVGAPGLLDRRWLQPQLDLSLRALPPVYGAVEAADGTAVAIEVTGGGGGAWSLVRGPAAWELWRGLAPSPAARVELDPETVWRSLYHALAPEDAEARATIEGDVALARPLFRARSVMV